MDIGVSPPLPPCGSSGLFSLSSRRRREERAGERRSYSSGWPLSPTLSPFVPHGEREKKGAVEPLVTGQGARRAGEEVSIDEQPIVIGNWYDVFTKSGALGRGSGSFAAEDDVGVQDVVAVLGDGHVAAADGEVVAAADPLTFGDVGAAGPGGLEGGAPFAGGGIVHGFRHPPVMDGAPDFRIVLGDDAVSG